MKYTREKLEELCTNLSKCGTKVLPYKRNPVPGLNFVIGANANRTQIYIWINPDTNISFSYRLDTGFKQCVLNVSERSASITKTFTKSGAHTKGASARYYWSIYSGISMLNATYSLVSETDTKITIKATTIAQKLSILLGMDEDHTFISFLPNKVSTVKQAHNLLMPEKVKKVITTKKRVCRQGEFFFIEETPPGKVSDYNITNNAKILNTDHITSLIMFKYNKHTRKYSYYVTGEIRNPRHKLLYLTAWYKVVRNTEIQAPENTTYRD